jgi:hypothetical protein
MKCVEQMVAASQPMQKLVSQTKFAIVDADPILRPHSLSCVHHSNCQLGQLCTDRIIARLPCLVHLNTQIDNWWFLLQSYAWFSNAKQ